MIQQHFSIPIYETILDISSSSIQPEIVDYIERHNTSFNATWSDPVYTTFTSFKDVLDKLPSLRDQIILHVETFLNDLSIEYSSIKINRSWINVTRFNGFQSYHVHGYDSEFVSGVYYFQTNGNDGNIVFVSDSTDIANNKFNIDKTVVISPAIGKLLLFPSFLKHKVTKNITSSDRISIAFNCELL